MGGEWRETTLADVSRDVSYGYTESATSEVVGPKFLRITDIQGGVVNWESVPHCPISEDSHDKYKLANGDIVVARTGNSTGENYLFRGGIDAVFASYLIRFRLDTTRVEPRFIWYNLRAPRWWTFINSSKTGSAQAGANAKVIGRFPLRLPPLREQRAIAHILGTLDDKIEVNRKMSQTLEEMARAIFKSWFVDFDPVRAKAAVRREHPNWTNAQVSRAACPNIKPEIAELFPDRLVDSELGEIPVGWEASTVRQYFRLTMGQSPPGSTYKENGVGVPFYQGRTDFGFRFPTQRVFCTAPTRFAETGDTLVSVRAPVGDVNMANEPCAVGRGVAAIRHKSGSMSFTYYSMNHLGEHFAKFEAEGTVFGCINKADFERLPFTTPHTEVLALFDRVVSPIDESIENSEKQIVTLAALRDTLLPKLISGELRVKDVERFVEGHV